MSPRSPGITTVDINVTEKPTVFMQRFQSVIDNFEAANEEQRHQHFRYIALLQDLSAQPNLSSNEIAVAFYRLMGLETAQYNALGISIGNMLRNCFRLNYPPVLTMPPMRAYRLMNDIDDELKRQLNSIYYKLTPKQKQNVNNSVTQSVVTGLKKYGENLSERHAKEGNILIELADEMSKKPNYRSIEDFRDVLSRHPAPQLRFLDKALAYLSTAIAKLFDLKIESVSSNQQVHNFFYNRQANSVAIESIHQHLTSRSVLAIGYN